MPNKSSTKNLTRGVATSEFWLALSSKLMGAVLILVAILKSGIDPDRSLMVIGIGAVMLLGVDTVYSFARAFLKSKTMAVAALVCLGLALAAPAAMAGLEESPTVKAPQVESSAPQAASVDQLKQMINKLIEQNARLTAANRALLDKLQAKPAKAAQVASIPETKPSPTAPKPTTAQPAAAPTQGLPVTRDPGDVLFSALARKTNEFAVARSLADGAYGLRPVGGQMLYANGYAAPAAPTQTDIKAAVKEAIESQKTWWDKAPWYIRAAVTIGSLAIFKDLGITLPGIN